jgi:hypothetical protein
LAEKNRIFLQRLEKGDRDIDSCMNDLQKYLLAEGIQNWKASLVLIVIEKEHSLRVQLN